MTIKIVPRILIGPPSSNLSAAVLDPSVVIDPALGLVSKDGASKNLIFTITSGPISFDGDWCRIYKQPVNSPTPTQWTLVEDYFQFTIANPGDTFTYEMKVRPDTGLQEHGAWLFCFDLTENYPASNPGDVDVPANTSETSPPTRFEIDLIPAYSNGNTAIRPPPLVYTGTLPAGQAFTLAHLTQFGFPFSIPANTYAFKSGQWDPNDKVRMYLTKGDIVIPAEEVGGIIPPRLMLQAGNTGVLTESDLNKSGSDWRLIYQIEDRAGNLSEPSLPSLPFTIVLAPAPANLQPIMIDQAPDLADDLINLADLAVGPTGKIPVFGNYNSASKYRFRVTWGGQPVSQWFDVVAFPITLDRLFLNPLCTADYGNAKGPKTTVVGYEIEQDGDIVPGPTTTIRVDLSYSGPTTTTPGSENGRLLVASFMGEVSKELNILREVDANQDVTITVVTWTGLETPTRGMWLVPQLADGTFLAPAQELDDTQVAGTPVSWKLPWSYFATLGNGPHKIRYVVSPTPTPTAATNLNPAPYTDINLIDAVVTALPAPQFGGARGTGASLSVNCDALTRMPVTTPKIFELRVFVAGNPKMVVGERLTLDLRITRPIAAPLAYDQTQSPSVPITDAVKASGHTFIFDFAFVGNAQAGRAYARAFTKLNDGTLGVGTATAIMRTGLSASRCDLSPLVSP
ncbi:hypothetical protein HX810_07445 [Pseudomonas salomonii]|uniref:Uncharacterized protein n=1 Tax=Pseudomonas salomonii TaxID=191391 RepID=A0A7Y8GC84_9PSED|nr:MULTISPECIES: hypothetical protein [Pseudomonas]NWF07497.1 hypothetical protein [Pseudomonas salomonii]CRM77568.1 hypothetical protein [Pseudomonas sp. 58 R 3]